MTRLYSNNYTTSLTSGINNSVTTIPVASVTNLPAIGAGDTCILTIQQGSTIERVSATAVSSLNLTVVRESDGSSASSFTSGAIVSLRATASSYSSSSGISALTGDVTASGSGSVAATIANNAVTLAKMNTIATASILGRTTASTGNVEVLSTSTVKTMLDLTGINSGDQTITLTSDVTGSGTNSFATTIAANAVTLSKMATMATASLLGRNTAGTGIPEVLSVSTVKSLLSLNNVENTALSTWAGTTNISILGTLTSGVWNATVITVTYGGSGRASATAYAPIVGGTTSTGAHQSMTSGSAGQICQSAGNAAIPLWSTPTYPSSSGTTRKVLISDGTDNVYSTETWAAPGTSGNVLTSDGTNWTSAAPTGGGTSRDAYTTTATAAGTTTLTTSSNFQQFFTGSTTQTVVMPVTSTLTTGRQWAIVNNSTGVVTVQSSGANTIIAIPALSISIVTCILTTGTTAASWDFYIIPNGSLISGSGLLLRQTSPTLVTPLLGTPTSGTLTNCTGLPYTGVTKPATAFYAYNSADQVISTGTSTKCSLNSEKFDSGGLFDSTTNYRFTPNIAGVYVFSAAVTFQSMVAGSLCLPKLSKNGGTETIELSIFSAGTGGNATPVLGMFSLNGTTDYVEFFVYQSSGSNKSTLNGASYTFFSGCLIERT